MDISHLRQQYKLDTLSKKDVDKDPIQQFKIWLQAAIESECPEPNAMVLSTVDLKGKPSARVVLLKEVTDTGFVFYTNYLSKKAKQMEENTAIAVTFNWLELQRQVRIEGNVAKTSRAKSVAYFNTRPRGSRIGAIVSEQSKFLDNRAELERKKEEVENRYLNDDNIPTPEDWGGYEITPTLIEFWQGRRSRLHDRLQYTCKSSNAWQIDRLSP